MHEHSTQQPLSDESRDEALDKAVRALPRELAPARDLWPALAARLPARRQQRWRGQTSLWVAAALLAAVWISPLRLTLDPASPPLPAATAAAILQEHWQAAHDAARASVAYHPSLALLTPGSEWDTAIAQVQTALREFPDDPFLLAQLDRLHRQRLDALRQAMQTAERFDLYY